MKPYLFSALLTACGLAFSALPAFAQEEIKPAAPPPAEKPEAARQKSEDLQHRMQQKRRSAMGETPPSSANDRPPGDGPRSREDNRRPQPEMRPTSYIGVLTNRVSPELSAQLGLSDGFGLVVEEVMPDSPALSAGIQQHDVLILFADQKLANQEQLSALVRAEKKDAQVVFTLKRSGTDKKVTVKIGEKMMPLTERRGPDGPGGSWLGMFGGREGERFADQMRENAERFGRELRDNGERFGEGLQQFGERMKEWSRGPKDRPAPSFDRPAPPPGNEPRRDGERRPSELPRDGASSSSSSSSTNFQRQITRRDESGEYSLREDNGAKVFSVKPKQGEEQSFIVNTDKQREAIPEQFRNKLKELETMNPPVPPSGPEKAQPKPGN